MLDRPHTDTPPDAYALFFFELCRAAMDIEQDPDKQLELLAKLITLEAARRALEGGE